MTLEWLYTLRRPEADKVDPPVATRRTAAVLAVMGYPLVWCVTSGLGTGDGILGMVLYVGLLLASLVLWAGSVTIVYEFRRRLAQAPDDQLDERERRLRDESYLISYRALSAITLLVGMAFTIAVEVRSEPVVVSGDTVIWVFASLLMASIALPSSVVAWRDREVNDPDEEEIAPEVGA